MATIHYSLFLRKENPADSESEQKVYAQAQYTTVMNEYELAKHIAEHNSKYNRADVLGVILSLVDCIKELLLDGKRIRLGELGTFYLQIKSKGADSVDTFVTADITGLIVKWSRGSAFVDLLDQASFEFVGRRKAQQLTLEQEKESLRIAQGTSSGSSSEGGSSSDESPEGEGGD
ncbi:MAG: HU family DNA-binding protein [Prevotellaceae bacterium]|nr:HU family DNA-binding protein [Prevotellaceae bacterium]